MDKHRLELFSDGVFAIVLTLLVLDLKVPSLGGFAGLVEVAPGLIVHAATFALVGILWLVHYRTLAFLGEVRTLTLVMNLAALFCVTLMPFGAKIAAERPMDPLGPSGLALCYGLYTLCFTAARQSLGAGAGATVTAAVRRMLRIRLALAIFRLACAGLAWISPWFGYLAMASVLSNFVLPIPHGAAATERGAA